MSVHSTTRVADNITVMGMMNKIGNIVPRAGVEPTTLALWASVLPLHYVGSLVKLLYPCLPVCVALCLRRQCRLLPFVSLLMIDTGNGFT